MIEIKEFNKWVNDNSTERLEGCKNDFDDKIDALEKKLSAACDLNKTEIDELFDRVERLEEEETLSKKRSRLMVKGFIIASIILVDVLIIFMILTHPTNIDAEEKVITGAKNEPFVIQTTAYTNPNHNLTYMEKETIEGLTVAGKKEWLGCCVALYEIDEGGGIGEFIGYYQVTDTGYGHDSTLVPGKGTIETGETIDIFFESYDTAIAYGEHNVYVQLIPGVG